MGRHPSIMVPIALLLVLPLVAATGHDMQDMMKMMEMMEMMNKMKGWGDKSMEMGSIEDAQVLVNMSKGDQIKAFFAGLKEAMCDGAEAYVEQVEAWEKQFKFLERLM